MEFRRSCFGISFPFQLQIAGEALGGEVVIKGKHADSSREYLRLSGTITPLFAAKNEPHWIKPIALYGLMAALNAALRHEYDVVEWTFEGDDLVQNPSWTFGALLQRIKITRKWIGSDPQLRTAIKSLVDLGFLIVSDGKYSVTTRCINWLLTHASTFYKEILDEETSPTDWTLKKGDWLEFNDHVFDRLYTDVGDRWREVRNAINLEISAHRPIKRQKNAGRSNIIDHLGNNPAYWLVVSFAGLLDIADEYDLMQQTSELGLRKYANGIEEISDATKALREAEVLAADGIRLTPTFAKRMIPVRDAIQKYIPELYADCEKWRDKRSPKPIRTRKTR